MAQYDVYTDGAYSSAKKQGGIGLVCVKNGEVILRYNKMYKDTTNNRMEVQAAITAMLCVKKPIDKLVIHSDSMYLIGCATLGWKRSKNQDLWDKYDKVYEEASKLCKSIEFIHVKGHNGDTFNSIADKLAVEATQQV